MDTLATTDADLLARYAGQRDSEAFAELVRRHAAMVYATCRRVCGASHADDAAQEAFLALARHAARIRDSVPGWLHVVATRKAARFARPPGEAVPLSEAQAAPAPDAELQALQSAVDRALAGLPDRLRAPLVLHFLEGRTQQEIATALALSQPTVQRRLQAGLAALRTALAHGAPATLAVALAALPRPAASAEVIAGCGRVALAAPVAAPGMGATTALLIAVVAAAAGAVAWLLRPQPIPPAALAMVAETGAPRAAVAEAEAEAVDPPAPVDALAIPWSTEQQASPGNFAWLVELALRKAGTPTRVVWSGSWRDEQRIDLRSSASVRALLDDVAREHGLRWSWRPGCLLLDRPLAETERTTLSAALRSAGTAEEATPPARAVAASGDLAAIHDLLVIAADAPLAAGDAMVHAYGESWNDSYMDRQLPLPLDPPLVDALSRRWRGLSAERLRVIDLVLVGQAGVQEARPRLHALLAEPASHRTRPPSAIRRDASDQFRVTAALALAWLGDRAAQKPILDWITADPRTRILPPLACALGHLGPPLDPSPLLVHHDLPSYEYSVFGSLYFALAHAAPPEAAADFIARRRAATDDADAAGAFIGGFASDPLPGQAAAIIDAFATGATWSGAEQWDWLPAHAASAIPADVIQPVLRAAMPRAVNAQMRGALLVALAVSGDAKATAEIIADGGGDLPARKRLAKLAVVHAEARAALLTRLAASDLIAGEADALPNQPEVFARLLAGADRLTPPIRQEVRRLLASAIVRAPLAQRRVDFLASADATERIELADLIPADEAQAWFAAATEVELQGALLKRLLRAPVDRQAIAIDHLEACRDAALCARLAPAITPWSGPPSSWGRRATLLARWMEAEDADLRLAAVRSVGENWSRVICAWSPTLIRGLKARCKAADPAVPESAQGALDNCRWAGSGSGWAYATWMGAVQGWFDDPRLLDEIGALLAVPAPATDPASAPAPAPHDF